MILYRKTIEDIVDMTSPHGNELNEMMMKEFTTIYNASNYTNNIVLANDGQYWIIVLLIIPLAYQINSSVSYER